jgi:thioesterase domain-containing protein
MQPRGPFVLAGYCFGGHVALELARHLREAGHEVALLCLIDARPYRPEGRRSRYLGLLLRGALHARSADWIRHLTAKQAMRRETRLIDRLARTRPDQLDRRELNRWVLETRILANYRSAQYPGEMAFFYPAESHYELYGDPSCGWLDRADRVYLVKVPGSHLDMMKEPNVREFSAKLEACWRQAAGRSSA